MATVERAAVERAAVERAAVVAGKGILLYETVGGVTVKMSV